LAIAQLEALGITLAKCPALQKIYLDANRINEMNVVQLEALGQVLAQCPSLTTLSLSHNKLNHLNMAGIEVLGQMLGQCQTLQTLHLEGNNLNHWDPSLFKVLGNLLAKCPLLETLYLGMNNLVELGGAQFQAFLNMIKASGVYRIINLQPMDQEHNTQLSEILQRNYLSKQAGWRQSSLLFKAAWVTTKITQPVSVLPQKVQEAVGKTREFCYSNGQFQL
jgi:Leucine-rich repeat (LRR) protein